MAPLSALIVGCGPRALAHVEAMRASDAFRPVGVWDRNHERAAELADRLKIPAFESITTGFVETAPELVDIVTNPHARWPLIDEALRAGASAVLVEKPIALSELELEKIHRTSAGVFLAVNTQYQWMPHWKLIRDDVRSGALGHIRSINLSTRVDLLEQGPHLLSLASSLLAPGDREAVPFVVASSDMEPEPGRLRGRDLIARIAWGSTTVNISTGASSPVVPREDVIWYQQQVDVLGDKGRAWVSLNQGGAMWTASGSMEMSTAWPRDDEVSQAGFLLDLARAIREPALQKEFPTRMSAAYDENRLLFAILESSAHGVRVTVEA